MRIVFLGTPEFGVPSLKALVEAGYEVAGVFTQPDKPKGRGNKMQKSPVKLCAEAYGIPVFQPVKIRVDGVELRDLRTDHLRRSIGMVLQEPFLFSRTIAENIAIHDPAMGLEAVRAAARAACLDETVQSFAKGYDTFVGERGVTLSGGQKQRAAIARTLTRNTPILIFDDSLSAVDTQTDAKIRASLESRFGSATVILISHRITTLSKADQILVLDHGRVVEQGSHEQLRAAGGLYEQICRIQSGSEEAAL